MLNNPNILPPPPIQEVIQEPVKEPAPEPIQEPVKDPIHEFNQDPIQEFNQDPIQEFNQDLPNIVNVIEDSFLIKLNKSDIDIKLIYTPLYFHTVGLTAEIVSKPMKGGYYQKYEDLTFPFKYVVWMVEKNPISIMIHNYLKPLDTNDDSFFKKITNMFKSPKPDENYHEDNEVESSDSDQEEAQEEAQEEVQAVQEEETQEEVQEEKTQEEVQKETQEEVQEEAKEEPELNIQSFSNSLSTNNIIIKIEMKPDIKNNGKTLTEIIQEYKQLPRTIESIPESGITYALLEKIVFDIYSQLLFLMETYNMIYSEFREDFIFNINDKYIILDIEKLIYLGPSENITAEKISENSISFSNFIQKLKYADIIVTNDNVIENTNVEKLRLRLSKT